MRCWPGYLLWSLIAVLGMGNMLTACGQSGDLYLPDRQEKKQQQQFR